MSTLFYIFLCKKVFLLYNGFFRVGAGNTSTGPRFPVVARPRIRSVDHIPSKLDPGCEVSVHVPGSAASPRLFSAAARPVLRISPQLPGSRLSGRSSPKPCNSIVYYRLLSYSIAHHSIAHHQTVSHWIAPPLLQKTICLFRKTICLLAKTICLFRKTICFF